MRRGVVTGVGFAVPDKILTNDDLSKIVDTNDEWIVQRTGIRERRIAGPEDTASSLGTDAARKALAAAEMKPAEVQMIVCGTVTGDMAFPSTACFIHEALGIKSIPAYDVGAACAGFIYALANANAMIQTGVVDNALVVGVDLLTKYVDWTDRSTCVLFGDGAGAVVLKASETGDRGLLKTVLLADGKGSKHINFESGGSRYPYGEPYSEGRNMKVYMNGAEVYRFAVTAMGDACCRVLETAGLEPKDVQLFVPHQANLRIIRAAQQRLGLPDERVFVNVEKYGNTSGASIPIGLAEAEQTGRLKQGDLVLTVGFGAGLVWGANLIRW
ncbi:MAG: beta-ketoacyl-ACP synthase III [Fimbriimonadaceae bacterium]